MSAFIILEASYILGTLVPISLISKFPIPASVRICPVCVLTMECAVS